MVKVFFWSCDLPGVAHAMEVIGEHREITLPIGTVVTVVLVHGDPEHPKAYEIEAHVPEQDCYVLATVEADNI